MTPLPEYDDNGNILSTLDALGGLTTYGYDANGNRLSETKLRTANGVAQYLTTTYQYDAENRLTNNIHLDGSSLRTVYAIGSDKPAMAIDPLGRLTLHFYDERNNLTNTAYADGTAESFGYDAENRKLWSQDKAGQVTQYTNDVLGRLIATRYPDGAVSNTVYDAIGRVSATSDERGNLTNKVDFNGRATAYTYDPLNRLLTKMPDPGEGSVPNGA